MADQQPADSRHFSFCRSLFACSVSRSRLGSAAAGCSPWTTSRWFHGGLARWMCRIIDMADKFKLARGQGHQSRWLMDDRTSSTFEPECDSSAASNQVVGRQQKMKRKLTRSGEGEQQRQAEPPLAGHGATEGRHGSRHLIRGPDDGVHWRPAMC